MDDINFKSRLLATVNCALSSELDEHICEEPVLLSCGHSICNNCLKESKVESLKCNSCNETKKIVKDLENNKKIDLFDLVIDQNLNELLKTVYEKLKVSFENFKNTFNGHYEKIDSHIDFIKDQMDIKIESLKNDLDEIHKNMSKKLDQVKINLRAELESWLQNEKIEENLIGKEMNELENSLTKNLKLTQESLYFYQNHIKKLKQIMTKWNKRNINLEFIEAKQHLKNDLVGEICLNGVEFDIKVISDFLEKGTSEEFKLIESNEENKSQISDMCLLPNKTLLLADCGAKRLLVYDEKMKFVKKIESIDGIEVDIKGCTCNENGEIYLSNQATRSIMKTNMEFNKLTENDDVSQPGGLCYYNESLFVCEKGTSSIVKLNSNLQFQTKVNVNSSPYFIKNIDNVAYIRFKNSQVVHFYDLNNLALVKSLNCAFPYFDTFGVYGSYFVEIHEDKRFRCYDKDGNVKRSETIIKKMSLDQPKPAFGKPVKSDTNNIGFGTTSLFGASGLFSNSNNTNNLFGSNTNNTGNLFGSNTNNTGNLFGSNTNNTGNLFGSNTNNTGNLFGSNTNNTGNLFGSESNKPMFSNATSSAFTFGDLNTNVSNLTGSMCIFNNKLILTNKKRDDLTIISLNY